MVIYFTGERGISNNVKDVFVPYCGDFISAIECRLSTLMLFAFHRSMVMRGNALGFVQSTTSMG